MASYGIRFLKVYKNPHPKGWGYTDEARLRGLIHKIDFLQPDLVSDMTRTISGFIAGLGAGSSNEVGRDEI